MAALKVLAHGAAPAAASVVASGGPAGHFVTPSLITFPAPDGTTLHGQLFQPVASTQQGAPSGEGRPAVLFTHGGCQRQMNAAMHYAGDYAALYAQNQYLVSQGFVVLSLNYRGGVGYGVKFRAANNSDWEGASEHQDVLAAGWYLAESEGVDPTRIAYRGTRTPMWSSSRPLELSVRSDGRGSRRQASWRRL